MQIVEWARNSETDFIPPLGDALTSHLMSYNGSVKSASCSAWGLLYEILKSNNLPTSTVAFTTAGKPYFTNSLIHFSISHTQKLCAVAVSNQLVGVDIELQRESYNPHLIERSLCTSEKSLFDGDFTRIWCRKEAVAKMTGEGITQYPEHIDTTKYVFREELIWYEERRYWLVSVTQ